MTGAQKTEKDERPCLITGGPFFAGPNGWRGKESGAGAYTCQEGARPQGRGRRFMPVLKRILL